MEPLIVSSSPHVYSEDTTARIMRDVVLALLPAAAVAVYFFGGRAALIMAISVLSAVVTEAVVQKLMKKPVTINDWSAAVTGLMLAFNLPPTVPLWLPAVGSAIAIALVKQAFGGLGHNFMNPALAARAILLAAWPVYMTTWADPIRGAMSAAAADAVSSATPLAILKGMEGTEAQLPPLWAIILGNTRGCLGETSDVALLLGAVYLLWRRVINWRIPFSFIGTVGLLTWILGPQGLFTGNAIYHIFSGGLILGAFYMATDYSSSPVTPKGQIIMGIGCGIITSIIRLYGGYPEGVTYSILLMNVATPLIDRFTMPRIYGEVRADV
ncbi:RnfABCDGE type electron transport complex subunit D [Caldicoprobacter faecalis]|uniref:Ion-translocating oxidoreductase complex subunit D n=1 Tax=Caldicoprobacter faecalis TaxID=937334 RepID=A0A1I5TII1_9FIRM|nr:RnfABCDGE type electron transport complex subunit D [Caldicoprobacter faecalis]SFP82835.1 electron transport complex protein RnfD [Caldicoprobacter faecalis]